jgi:hypothetical protein
MANRNSDKKEYNQRPRSEDLRKPPPEERETHKDEIIGLLASIFRKQRSAENANDNEQGN